MKKIIAIVGPTAVGKTALSIALSKHFGGEVVNADSTQVYRGLDIATAKVTEEEKEGVVHHLFDIRDIREDYTVYDYQKDARRVIEQLLKEGKTPILVGGTGFYLKAALYDYRFPDMETVNQYEDLSTEEIYQKLKEVDPEIDIHKNNRKRLIRAYQYYQSTGRRFSEKEKTDKLLYPVSIIGLTTNREELYQRINTRVDEMVKTGLLEEARAIYDSKIRTKAIMTPIGYKELFPYFDGNCTLEDALNEMKKNSRHYAKRQFTWFRNQMPVVWFDVDFNHFDETIKQVIDYLEKELAINKEK